jgi:hypothetical protein
MIDAAFVALGILASAIQWGWQPLTDGGREYIVQVEPQLTDIDAFRKSGFTSDVPPGLRDIRRIRIVVGSDPLPNQGEMAPADAAPPKPSRTASQPLPTVPGTLPAGVSAEPLKPARTFDPRAAKVALADGHQPADAATNGSEPNGESTAPAEHSTHRSPSDERDSEASPAAVSAASSTAPPRPWLTLLAVAGGLIVSLSGNVFLGWAHWGTRNQYRALVSQLRAQRSA